MKNGVVTILVVLFIGVSLMLSTALFQYSKKYEAVKSKLDKVEGLVDELEEQSGFVLSNKLEERVDLHTARISCLEKHNRKRKEQATVEDQYAMRTTVVKRVDSLSSDIEVLSEKVAALVSSSASSETVVVSETSTPSKIELNRTVEKRIDSLASKLLNMEKEMQALSKQKSHQSGSNLSMARIKKLEKSVDSIKKHLSPTFISKLPKNPKSDVSQIKKLEKSVDSLKRLLAPSIGSKAPNKRVEKAKAKSVENRTGLRVVTVEELHKAHKENDVAAKHTYGSKFVLLRGVVRSVEGSGKIKVVLETKNGWNFIICYFDKSASNSLLGVKKGDVITIKGKYQGYVQFKYCSLVE